MTSEQPDYNREMVERLRPLNRVASIFAGRILYGRIEHRGRKSGRTYQTSVVAWPVKDAVVIPLPYGVDTDWHKNVKAAGECRLTLNGKIWNLERPRQIDRHEALAHVPLLARIIIQLTRIDHYVYLSQSATGPSGA
jgi:deazaflavin-dependent oxidoreductase (nitroreductase family)